MIKVCHITSVHNRYDTRIFLKECTSLAQAGYDVTLLVADEKPPEVKNAVSIISVAGLLNSRVKRIIKSSKIMFNKALEIDAEIYHLHDPELLPLARKLKRKGKKVIFDSHEDVCGNILRKQWIPKIIRPIVFFIFKCYSNFVFSKLDYLIGVTPHLVEKLKISNPRTEIITNYPLLNLEDNNIERSTYNTKSFCFAGGITEQWNHQTILSALEDLDATYDLMGRAEPGYLSKLQKSNSWDKVKYHELIPQQKVMEILSSCSVGLAMLDYSENTGGKIGTLGNTKLFEYMQAGLPVICTDFLLWKEIIEKWNCGICIPPGDTIPLKEAMQRMIDNPDTAEEMGRNGKRAVLEEFNWGIEERKLLKLYKQLSDI